MKVHNSLKGLSRSNRKPNAVTTVVDSVATLSTRVELGSNSGNSTQATPSRLQLCGNTTGDNWSLGRCLAAICVGILHKRASAQDKEAQLGCVRWALVWGKRDVIISIKSPFIFLSRRTSSLSVSPTLVYSVQTRGVSIQYSCQIFMLQ